MNIKKIFWKLYRKIHKLPKFIKIDASTICQLDCRDCYMRGHLKHTKDPIVGLGVLSFKNFKKLVDNNPYIEIIELSHCGEIFLNPELIEIIKYAHKKNITLTALNGVNFNTVSDEIIEALVKYKFGGITFSIDGTSNETYSVYRKNGNYNKVIENIKKLNEYKQKYNSIYPILIWQYIIFKHNKHEIYNVEETAKELNFSRYYFKEGWIKEIDISSLNTRMFKTIDNREEVINFFKRIRVSNCEQPWLSPQINWDGRLIGCEFAVYHDMDINVFEIGLKKALKAKKLKFMKDVLTGKEEANHSIPCLGCPFYESMKEKNTYINPKKLRFN